MRKAFRPVPLELLARWIFGDLERGETVLGIPKENFALPGRRLASRRFGRALAAPLGLAAGPHTQLAQNIVAGWLCGARFVELKTVQVQDDIAVSRPCIDSADETYNCEWSQELRLEESFQEYLHAWVLVHALAHRLGLEGPGTLFTMSVGYDLAGIQSPAVQGFLSSMRGAGRALPAAVEAVARVYPAIRDVEVPTRISDHVTLSTMHGCPPAEIERMARYLLDDLGVHTWVKLNPTLLGPVRLRGILNRTLGYDVEVPDAAFEHDPRLQEAMAMARSLARAPHARAVEFGLKLSNTLEVVNRRAVFAQAEKTSYLSGRALHPLTLALAALVGEELDGRVPVSFCGGADAESFADLVADGLSPVTVCTDLLKPGGYARLQQYLANLEGAMIRAGAETLDAFVGEGARARLAAHAERVLSDPRYARRERPLDFKGPRPLGWFDCVAAPCQEACPARQNVPDYLWLLARGRPSEAMEVILRANPQPAITGRVCDHPCTSRCVRNFYDAPLAIRELKRFAVEHGAAPREQARPANGVKVAIVGAGPAGLSAAYHLARAGFEPVVYEAKATLGGMASAAIPAFRLGERSVQEDVERVLRLGVAVHLGKAVGRDVALDGLRREHRYVLLAVGAQKGKRLGVPGDDADGVLDALELLKGVAAGAPARLGRRVLVVGGGNAAMDAARAARRLLRGGEVAVVYRRSRAEMPADPEEVRACAEEGIALRELLAPARVVVEGGRAAGLACTRMKLGERDGSGRRRPVPLEGAEEEVLAADAVVAAVGQEPVLDFLAALDVARGPDDALLVDPETCETSVPGLFAAGDVARGPASVIQAIADGRAVAHAILRRHGVAPDAEPHLEKGIRPAAALARKARRTAPRAVPALAPARRVGFAEAAPAFDADAAAEEASRCLDCDELCSLCVTVCPNRANVAYSIAPFAVELPSLVARQGGLVARGATRFAVRQAVQIANVGDLCNECGNCLTFCPTSGAPHRAKPRLWIDARGYAEAAGDAFRVARDGGAVAVEARLSGATHRLERRACVAEYRSEKVLARFDAASWSLLGWEPLGPLAEGEEIDLSPCATLIALLQAEPAIPG